MTKKYDFSQVDTLKKKLDALRPLNAELYQKLKHKLAIDWTYNSNAIEGNTLTLSETRFFLEVGLTSKGKPLSEYLETKNHKHAIDYLEKIVKEKEPLSERLIKELHAMLFERNEEYEIENEKREKVHMNVLPGKYKLQNNYVLLPDGSQKNYMDPLKVIDAMQSLIKFYNEKKEEIHPILLAAELHTQFVAIHPFVDGNGRVARLIMNIILMQAGYEPTIIQNELKQDYYEALRHYDETNDIEPFVEIVEQEVIRTLQITLRAAEGKTIFEVEDVGRRIDTFAKTMEALEKDVGKTSKKVTDEEKKESIRNIREYLNNIAEKEVESSYSELFQFNIIPLKIEGLEYEGNEILEYLEKRNIITEIKWDRRFNQYSDYIQDENDGSVLSIILKSKRSFIPSSSCSFVIIPTKYTLCICSAINITRLEDDGSETDDNNILVNFIENGVLWEDWHKKDIDHFFTEVFNQYLLMLQEEAERRRLFAERKTNTK